MNPGGQALRLVILRRLADGPQWARSFQAAKLQLTRAVASGLVERVAPPGGRGRNMVRLTSAGERELERLDV